MPEKNEQEIEVDPQSMTVAIHPGEMVVMPVDCDADEFANAIEAFDGIEAVALPDRRVAVRRTH